MPKNYRFPLFRSLSRQKKKNIFFCVHACNALAYLSQKKFCTKFFPLAQSIFPYFLCQATFFCHFISSYIVWQEWLLTLGIAQPSASPRKKEEEKTLSRPTIYPFTTCHIPALLLWQIEGRVHAAADPNISLHFSAHLS